MNRKTWLLGIVLAVGGVALTACADKMNSNTENGSAGTDAVKEVRIDNFTFTPETLVVAAGTKVRWTNRDDIPHTVVSEDRSTFKSKALDTDDSFSFTFTKSGTYTYFCTVHPKMTGKVVVQ